MGMASSPVGAGASGFYAAIDSSLHTWSASNAVRFLTTANASCSSVVMQVPIPDRLHRRQGTRDSLREALVVGFEARVMAEGTTAWPCRPRRAAGPARAW